MGTSTDSLVRCLKTVPEVRPRILDLAAECLGPDGLVDLERAALRMKEIEDAAGEAIALFKATEKVRWALTRQR